MITALDISLGMLGFVLPLSIAAANIAGGAALALWLAVLWKYPSRRGWRKTGVEVPWVLFLAAGVLSAVFSVGPERSAGKLAADVLIVVLAAASQGPSGPQAARRMAAWWMAGSALAGVGSVVSSLTGVNLSVGRARGFFNHPVTYGEVALLGVLVSLGWVLTEKSARRWGAAAAGTACLAGLFLSRTRGALLGFGVALALWGVVRRDKRIVAVLALGMVLTAGAIGFSPSWRERWAGVVHPQADSSGATRLGIWVKSVEVVRRRPLTGLGMGHLRLRPDELPYGDGGLKMDWTETHQMFLQAAVDRGLLGLAAFVFLLIRLGVGLRRAAGGDPRWEGLFWGFVALTVAGLTESWFNDSEVVMNVYFLAGAAMAATAPEWYHENSSKGGSSA
jgi:O-antigen ligase